MMLFAKVRRGAGKIAWSLVALWVVVALVVATILAGFMVLYNDRRELIDTNQALIDQVKRTGQTPVVGSPNEVVQGQAGARGPVGERGPQGVPGVRGQTGERGPAGAPGQDGADGAPGADGKDSSVVGPAGSAGADGADSTVPGPTGATGAQGAAGPQGEQGPQGAAGPAGAAGKDGAPGADGRSVSAVQCVMDGAATYAVFYDQAGAEIGRIQQVCVPST